MAGSHNGNAPDDTPVYTIKTVVQITGITPATLRAWERRYNVLSPGRSDGGYRLYSEHDIVTLLWLKGQVEAGVTISRAVALLERYHNGGEQPELAIPLAALRGPIPSTPVNAVRSREAITEELLAALLAFGEADAEILLNEAFALYPVEVVAEEIVAPALVQIGERWHRGDASIVQEHFATAFLRRRLTALFHAYDQPGSGPLAVTGSAPSEWHDIGILLVSLALRRAGWRVIYLGQNVPADHLAHEIARLRPELVCISATTRESATDGLLSIAGALRHLPEPRPQLIVGGNAFNAIPELRDLFPGSYLGGTAREVVARLKRR
jgi:DNA-binding transcriptional MerR regulator/methylmalonyl-CoA mutase cobalamin-binding subunit